MGLSHGWLVCRVLNGITEPVGRAMFFLRTSFQDPWSGMARAQAATGAQETAVTPWVGKIFGERLKVAKCFKESSCCSLWP